MACGRKAVGRRATALELVRGTAGDPTAIGAVAEWAAQACAKEPSEGLEPPWYSATAYQCVRGSIQDCPTPYVFVERERVVV